MKIKLSQGWNGYRIGQEMILPDGMANVLIRRGFAVVPKEATASNAMANINHGKRRRA